MRYAGFVVGTCLALAGCGPNVETRSWVSQPFRGAPYTATLTGKTFNWGESASYTLQLDAAPAGGDRGWGFRQDVDSGGAIRAVRPRLKWTSPTDLLVVVHTDRLSGTTVRRLNDLHRPAGSLTYRYIADQP